MNKRFTFVKVSNRWLVDVPYDGSISDLEMVLGADELLDAYAIGREVDVYTLETIDDFSEYSLKTNCDNYATLVKKCQDDAGTTYIVESDKFNGNIWLCPVFNLLIGESPDKMEIGIHPRL